MLPILSQFAIYFIVMVVFFLNFFASPNFPGRSSRAGQTPTPFKQASSSVEKSCPILVILENGVTPITPVHHVMERSGKFNPNLARHADNKTMPNRKDKVENSGTDPFI